MAVIKKKYVDINDTLKHIKIQIIDSIDFALNCTPPMQTPEQIFNFLKKRIIYKSDPRGVELLQSLPTLLENNYHNKPGAGDCDCFTIATVALLIANNFDNINIVLVGRSRTMPVHIYTVIYKDNKRIVLDLTNKRINQERPYPYIQEIPVNWKKW